MTICSIHGCGRPIYGHGWCNAHYKRWRRHGDPTAGRKSQTPAGEPGRFLRDVVLVDDRALTDGCLIWPYNRGSSGRGMMRIEGAMRDVHRFVCETIHGAAPTSEHEAAHLCGKGHLACVTPSHLGWKTPAENQADRILHGTYTRGERHPSTKITEEQAREVMGLRGVLPQRAIAERFGISQATVSDIHTRRSWGWLQ